MLLRILPVVVVALILVLSSAGVFAHRDATGIVKRRMDAMESMGSAMKGLRAMMRGSQPYDVERVKAYAGTVAGHAGGKLTVLFPEGSLDHPTRANPAIWLDWDRFSYMARRLTVYAEALAAAASNERGAGDAATTGEPTPQELAVMAPDAVFMRLQKNCSGCHRTFRNRRSDSSPHVDQWADSRENQSLGAARDRWRRVAEAAMPVVTSALNAAAR